MLKRRQLGLSLVEFMVGSAIGLFLALALMTVLANSVTSYTKTQKLARLNQEMRAAMDLMAREIRRAGYWGSPAPYGSGALAGVGFGAGYDNPFATLDVATAGCIRFSYDNNGDGSLGTSAPDERFAFALDSGRVLMRSGNGATGWDCSAAASNAWEPLTDNRSTTYTVLSFELAESDKIYVSGSTGPNLRTRYVTIRLTAQSADDASIRQSLTESVKLVNDLYSPS